MAYELHRSLRPSRHRRDTRNTQVVLLCSFHNNDVTWSQFQVMIVLLQSFIESLTVVLPFYPVGTMERVVTEGEVATANTYAQMLAARAYPSTPSPRLSECVLTPRRPARRRDDLHERPLERQNPPFVVRLRQSETN